MLARWVFVMAALGVAAVASAPSPAAAELGDMLAIRSEAARVTAKSRELEKKAGPDYQRAVLEAVRRSCAARGVTRLDEIVPASVTTEARTTPPEALFAIDFVVRPVPASAQNADAAAGPVAAQNVDAAAPNTAAKPREPDIERVDKDTDYEIGASGLLLRAGQVRTKTALALPRDSIGTIELDIATTKPGHLLLGWSDDAGAPRLRRNNARIELVADGHIHTYAVDAADTLARGLESGSSVRRFFLSSRGEAPLEIRAMRVLSRAHRYSGQAFGSTHESRAGELRSVLYVKPPTTLEFDLAVPAESPVFEAGLNVLAGDGVLEFEVTVIDGETRTVLLKRLIKEAPWEEVALDLAPWAGRKVKLALAARGTRDAIALWSSPLVRSRLAADRTEPYILLLEDALRADRLSVYGGPVAAPAHERIAASGLTFFAAFSQATQTRSSVPSVMTSLLPSATGTWDFSDALSSRYVTLAETLRACGFATASFLQNGNAGAYAGLAQGFDVVFDAERFGPRAADLLAADSPLEKWIDRQRGRPYFAYVHVLDPHGPYDPAERPDLAEASKSDELQRDRSIDAEWLTKPTAAARKLLYEKEVATNDAAIGGFLDRLDARGDLSRATLAVIADHGEFLGEHGGLWRHHPPAHFEVARVPFLLMAPGTKARRLAEAVALLDVMPTFLDLAGIDARSMPMHGLSLAPALRGEPPSLRAIPADEMILASGERRTAGCGSFVSSDTLWLLSCTRDEDFVPGRLLAQRSGGPAPLRTFDLTTNPPGFETTTASTAGSMSEGIARRALTSMQDAGLAAWKRMTDAAAGRIVSEPLDTERLRALGYVE